ncbi:hypothetical protein GPY51_17190 [Photorhabdus laumondii subsp. laumondii]|uniref:Photorhabdus luminescens subsp. laumondii TTO1 complete genome segment 12/17 n=4 Tax=Photorhabdus TaxID=29487 RepID=Q7N1I5_PHOLL|nr:MULTISPECIES: hypothetical protein [Photorhabdus]MCC8385852.1 hypothetical protein [Photorhabdus laumondii]MCC8390252.1 hypothetical protein [Photorhabdus laumondii]MCC8414844.1 hypothetical protein [Photorhabdus laumondii]MCZ1251080.1 hypothetical protein [Photorhabdus laumondii subsp. laumondii]NDK96059.1 hypothetical protein [Photorhabdus laumondii subsp. laumondii]
MSQIIQSVKVVLSLAKSSDQGFAALRSWTLVRSFYQCACYRPSMAVQAGEVNTSPEMNAGLQTLFESPPPKREAGI